ncbi:MAG TPA: chemotaxis protein CheB [Pirellulales bacterium]|nr:chemotaxis protein CheB [Pirellulales bacterium]
MEPAFDANPLIEPVEGWPRGKGEPLYIVGIGASAGGLESLEQMFRNMPRDSNLAFVVIQHLSPDFKSFMDELLARQTDIPVCRAEHEMVVEPNHIYLIPPRKDMIISGCKLLLTDKDPKQALTLPIDHFFRSLAQDAGSRAMAVVLSGSGSDGSRGIRDIHAAGGLVICESLSTAKFDGMPVSAIETGVVDLELPPEQIAEALVRHARTLANPGVDGSVDVDHQGFAEIFELLNQEYGLDFSHYKSTTVGRRIQRRLPINKIDSLREYTEKLRDDAVELNALYKDLLIGVTRFFRDPGAFAKLEEVVFPELLRKVPREQEIRVWVTGCATGEEAYSVAMLLHEQLEAAGRPINAKVFATDAHRGSLEIASLGVYGDDALADVGERRLARYFHRQADGYHVGQELRQMIVFAPHNLLKDAPFTKLDLVTCRNLLIYLQPLAQKKTLSLLHFGLKVDGILLLGPSETPGELQEEFSPLDDHWKLYRKRRDVALSADARQPLRSPGVRGRSPLLVAPPRTMADATLVAAYDTLLGRYMPPGFLISDRRELLHVFGDGDKFLRIRPGRSSTDVFDLLHDEFRAGVTGAIQKASKELVPVQYSGVRATLDGREAVYRVSAEPVENRRSKSVQVLVSIVELAQPSEDEIAEGRRATPDSDVRQLSRDRIENLEAELRYTKENLQATIEQLETSNEELQATNEELMASNEELQSTNEELHSVNEELYTVNAEYQNKIAELVELHADLESLLASTEVGTIFLDQDMRIRKFTPSISRAFQLLPQDVGRRIDSFAHRLHADLVQDIEVVLRGGAPCHREVLDRDGRCYLLRIFPYQTPKGINGAVLTLVEVSALKEAESALAEAVRRRDQFLAMLSHELRNPLNAVVSAASLLAVPDAPHQTVLHAQEIIRRQSEQMARLLDELLDVSRMTQNKMQLRKCPFDLRRSINDAIAAVEARLRQRNIEFTQRIADGPLYVNGDSARLQQAITNLLDNACKYTPAGGHIWLSAQPEGDEVVVRIKDTGIGIEPALLEKVFDLFVQTERTLDRASGGMGVGLTLVRSIAQLHDGNVEAHSAGTGCGSEFVLHVPAAPPSIGAAAENAPVDTPVGQGKLVVVIDDETDNREMLQALLQLHGYHVRSASNGQEGVELIERLHPQAALIDIGLPGMSGYEVAEHVRRNLMDDRTYLVAVTGYGQREDVQQAFERGFDRHIVKPLTIDKLRDVLAECAAEHRLAGQLRNADAEPLASETASP